MVEECQHRPSRSSLLQHVYAYEQDCVRAHGCLDRMGKLSRNFKELRVHVCVRACVRAYAHARARAVRCGALRARGSRPPLKKPAAVVASSRTA